MSTQLNKVAIKAKCEPNCQFTSLAHLLTPAFLLETWEQINKRGAAGIDRVSIREYERNLKENIDTLIHCLKKQGYRAPVIRRVEIPKSDGRTRPLGITTVEDRLLQRAVAKILMAIYEQDYLDCSFGFRPKRNPHQALSKLRSHFIGNKVTYVLEADIESYFDKINHQWIIRMLKHRIKDKIILRLIGKWLKAGVMINGVVHTRDEGTHQGGPISVVLANIYLHYALDLWFEKRIKPTLQGEAYLIRFVDDFVVCFQKENELNKFQEMLNERFRKFGLQLSPKKTKGMKFGRFAREDLVKIGKKPDTFEFLGFKHICGKDRKGKFALVRLPSQKACNKFCDKTRQWLQKHQHHRVIDQQKHLTSMLLGFYQYFGITHCGKKLSNIHVRVLRQWRWVLQRRSQRNPYKYWSFLKNQPWFKLPMPRIIHKAV